MREHYWIAGFAAFNDDEDGNSGKASILCLLANNTTFECVCEVNLRAFQSSVDLECLVTHKIT